MRDDFNRSSFCETMSFAHACSAAMVRAMFCCFQIMWVEQGLEIQRRVSCPRMPWLTLPLATACRGL